MRQTPTYRRDLKPRRVIGVITEHGHVVSLSGALGAATAAGAAASASHRGYDRHEGKG